MSKTKIIFDINKENVEDLDKMVAQAFMKGHIKRMSRAALLRYLLRNYDNEQKN